MMMTAKMAVKNLKKSFRDYIIYFLTIAFGVCLFYSFNSLDNQPIIKFLNKDQRDYYQLLLEMINGISIFVSIILAFLIIYANKFLIKRRNKELSIYMILGMDKRKISSILVFETLFTGLIALVIGTVIGIFASQGLSVAVATLFRIKNDKFYFSFSPTAVLKTIIYFAIIFLIVMIFNVVNISHCKLINLIQSKSKNENGKIKNFWVSLIIFIVSIICIIIAYNKILKNGFMQLDDEFKKSIAFGLVGTLLLFISISGFIMFLIKKSKRIYYRHLNMFTIRQLSSKINTNCISLTIISIMLLITIGVLACALSINNAMNNVLEKANQQDVTFMSRILDDKDNKKLTTDDFTTDDFANEPKLKNIISNQLVLNLYYSDYTLSTLSQSLNGSAESLAGNYKNIPVEVISLSDYNKMMKMRGQETLNLNKDSYAFSCNSNETIKYFQKDKMPDLKFNKTNLSFYGKEIIDTQVENMPMLSNYGMIIVNDEYAENLEIEKRVYIANYKDNKNYDEEFKKIAKSYCENNTGKSVSLYVTKQDSYNAQDIISILATFLSIYVGAVFLITSCAVLALQQLTESADNSYRYKLLKKIGASSKDINSALFKQISFYFFAPLVVAVIHAVVGIKAASKLINLIGGFNILSSALVTAGIIIIVYGGYFLATYFSSKNIIKK